VKVLTLSGRGVTANMLDLGSSDSGFESRRPDIVEKKKFSRTIEDFTCEHCGRKVIGNGYTNHCPHCLWSKHVDKNPGDRAEICGGMMEPVATEKKGQELFLVQRCVKCGFKRNNSLRSEDNFETFIEISKKVVKDFYEGQGKEHLT
jgi:hypothetical protein